MSARVSYCVGYIREPEAKQRQMTSGDCVVLGTGTAMEKITALRVMVKTEPNWSISQHQPLLACPSDEPWSQNVRTKEGTKYIQMAMTDRKRNTVGG